MRNKNKNSESGFTLIELLVVTAIMAIIATIGIVNWNAERSTRSLLIGQNESITNIRKVQSYAISSRTSPAGAAKYYVMMLKTGEGETGYKVYAATGDNYTLGEVETIKYPSGFNISNILLAETTAGPSGSEPSNPSCVFIIFSVIYGKTYFTSTDNECSLPDLSYTLSNFPSLSTKANYNLNITYTYKNKYKYARVCGLSGKVESVNSSSDVVC